jgi:hypothetical protein
MEKMSLAEAFGRYGATTQRVTRRLSMIAADGALILGCSARYFHRPTAGVLRYEDKLSREAATPGSPRISREHLDLALNGKLPVRLIVITSNGHAASTVHVRQDLVGSVVDFDGDHYIIDFVRAAKAP